MAVDLNKAKHCSNRRIISRRFISDLLFIYLRFIYLFIKSLEKTYDASSDSHKAALLALLISSALHFPPS